MTHENERHKHLSGEPPDERSGKSDESVCFNKFVKVNVHQLHSNAKMVSKVKMVIHFDDMMFLVSILQT